MLRDSATGAARIRLEGHADAVTAWPSAPTARPSPRAATTGRSGSGTWPPAGSGPRSRANQLGLRRGLQPRRPDPRLGRVRPDGPALGRRLGPADGDARRPGLGVRALAFCPDGRTLASAGADRVATLWDLADLAAVGDLRGHRGTIRALAFAPDGRPLATAGEDGEVKLWDAWTGRERATLTGHADMVLAWPSRPRGRRWPPAGSTRP